MPFSLLTLSASCEYVALPFVQHLQGLQAELLSIICIDFECVVIAGDFIIQGSSSKELCRMTQHVAKPTHNKGCTLDKLSMSQ